MGKRGPRAEPSILKYIRGNPSKRALPDNEPTPQLIPADFPVPPLLQEPAATVWVETVDTLHRMRVLTQADIPALTRYCIETTLYVKCWEKVQTAGEEYIHWEKDPNRKDGKLRIKYTQVAPWATQMHRHHNAMLQLEREFGMTPSSRSQVATTDGQKKSDEIKAFVQKRSDQSGG